MKLQLALVMLAAVFPDFTTVDAQGPARTGRNFDPKTLETVEGKVASIAETAPPADRGFGVHLTLQSERETITVHLGPRSFLEKQKLQFKAGDIVTVRGSRVTIDGKPVLIAAEVTKATEVLKLREANGRPNWAGGPRRN